jgi:hypothetical protein
MKIISLILEAMVLAIFISCIVLTSNHYGDGCFNFFFWLIGANVSGCYLFFWRTPKPVSV